MPIRLAALDGEEPGVRSGGEIFKLEVERVGGITGNQPVLEGAGNGERAGKVGEASENSVSERNLGRVLADGQAGREPSAFSDLISERARRLRRALLGEARSDAQHARLRAWLAAHPDARADWDSPA